MKLREIFEANGLDLGDALGLLHDRIHPTSGRLLSARPVRIDHRPHFGDAVAIARTAPGFGSQVQRDDQWDCEFCQGALLANDTDGCPLHERCLLPRKTT